MIILQPVSETIMVAIEDLFKHGQHLLLDGMSEDIVKENSKLEGSEEASGDFLSGNAETKKRSDEKYKKARLAKLTKEIINERKWHQKIDEG